jgi:hypothetical protein
MKKNTSTLTSSQQLKGILSPLFITILLITSSLTTLVSAQLH